MNQDRRGPCIGMLDGRKFWPLDPRPADFAIEDIAAALSKVCRFGGRCSRFYSVAQHSVLVMELVEQANPDVALLALLHDAAEAYIGDIISPLKTGMFHADPWFGTASIRDLELRIHTSMLIGLGVPIPSTTDHEVIKAADEIALATEARDLMGNPDWWGLRQPDERRIEPLAPDCAERAFLAAYARLKRGMAAEVS